MFPNAVRHEVSNSSAMATRNIIDAIPATTSSHMATILTLHQGPTWALRCFLTLWKMCEQFRPIFTCIGHFSLVVVKSSMTSYIHFIVTNMRMWKNLDLLDPCWPFVWGYKSWPLNRKYCKIHHGRTLVLCDYTNVTQSEKTLLLYVVNII